MEGNEEKRKRGCPQELEENGGIGKVEGERGCFGGRKSTRVMEVKDAEGEMQQEGGSGAEERSGGSGPMGRP